MSENGVNFHKETKVSTKERCANEQRKVWLIQLLLNKRIKTKLDEGGGDEFDAYRTRKEKRRNERKESR